MSNCFIFALRRWFKRGGYLIIRKSDAGWYPHFIWAESLKDLEIEHYTVDEFHPLMRFMPAFLFKGYVKKHDNDRAKW